MGLLEKIKHLFAPDESNNHKAGILHPRSLSLVVAIFLVFQFGLNFSVSANPLVLGFASNITPEKIAELTNHQRAENGLPFLTLNPLLSEAALRKAADMFAFNYWAHNSPSGRDPWSFFKEVDYQYLYAGENLARDFADSKGVISAWMASPTHRDNIVNGQYQETGVAVVDGTLEGVQTTLVVQLFGKPAETTARIPQLLKSIPAPVIGKEAVSTQSVLPALTSPFTLTKNLSIFILGLLTMVILLELAIIRHRGIMRISGRNLAHIAFLGIMILIVLMVRQGLIL